jgi:hypothetical protein
MIAITPPSRHTLGLLGVFGSFIVFGFLGLLIGPILIAKHGQFGAGVASHRLRSS